MINKDDEEEKKRLLEDDETGESGETGQTGAIEFRYRDILSTDARDDILPESEIRRLLSVLEQVHKGRVDNQKIERKRRDDLKQGRVQAQSYDALGLRIGGGAGGGGTSPYKTHPLSEHAQFSGATDRKVTGVPSDSLSETNDDMQNKLREELDLRHRHQLQAAPKFNPKPRGPYG